MVRHITTMKKAVDGNLGNFGLLGATNDTELIRYISLRFFFHVVFYVLGGDILQTRGT